MHNRTHTLVTVYDLSRDRAGLVRALAQSNGLSEEHQNSEFVSVWTGDLDHAELEQLLNSLMRLKSLSFDVIHGEPSPVRFVYAPTLGLGSVDIDALGNAILSEHRIRQLMRESNQNMMVFERLAARALLRDWEEHFESIRAKALAKAAASERVSVA